LRSREFLQRYRDRSSRFIDNIDAAGGYAHGADAHEAGARADQGGLAHAGAAEIRRARSSTFEARRARSGTIEARRARYCAAAGLNARHGIKQW
jgi:hypothetical protein